MSLFPVNIYLALKTELEDKLNFYIDMIDIRKYRRTNLPDFENYCIIISPLSAKSMPYQAGGQRWIWNVIDIIILGKMRSNEYDAVMADEPHAEPPNVGILAMYEDVFSVLYKNNLNGEIELIPGIEELDTNCEFSIISDEDREEFIIESRLPYLPRGHKFINLEEWES